MKDITKLQVASFLIQEAEKEKRLLDTEYADLTNEERSEVWKKRISKTSIKEYMKVARKLMLEVEKEMKGY